MSRFDRVCARNLARSRTPRRGSISGTWHRTLVVSRGRVRGPRWNRARVVLAKLPIAGWWALAAASARDLEAAKARARRESRAARAV